MEEEVLYKLFTCSKPVVAAINGHATAAGRSFIGLKIMEKKDCATIMRQEIDAFDWNILVELFTSKELLNTLLFAKQALGV